MPRSSLRAPRQASVASRPSNRCVSGARRHDAPEGLAPIDAVAAAIEAAGAELEERRERARQRQASIAATAELRERELIKLAALAAALAAALRQRGVDEPAASLTAEAGIAVFRIAVERWVDEANQRSLPELRSGGARGLEPPIPLGAIQKLLQKPA
jgi:hypothetical protein